MKKIIVINGHPDKESFNKVIADTYVKTALDLGAEVRYIHIGTLDFNPNLQFGYRKRMQLEPDLLKALEDIHWGEHQVWIHPIWWLGMPSIMKGFIDRAFLPGITFTSHKNQPSEGLLEGKTGRIITTAGDMSLEVYQDVYKSSGLVQLQKGILEYCGVSDIQNNFIGPLLEFGEADCKEQLENIKAIARADIDQISISSIKFQPNKNIALTTEEVVEAFYDIQSGRKDGNIIDLFADGVDWDLPGNKEKFPWTGKRSTKHEIEQFFKELHGNIKSESFEIDFISVNGEHATAVGKLASEILTYHKVFETEFVVIFKVVNGKIVKYHFLEDSYKLNKEMQ